MTAKKPVSLPLLGDVEGDPLAGRAGHPTVEQARRALGGRASASRPGGDVVLVAGAGAERAAGVIVFRDEREAFVWIGDGVLRRLPLDHFEPHPGPIPPELASVAADARLFGSLAEGERVRFERSDGDLGEGTLVEKCRFGGMVELDAGGVMAVIFRRLWPVPEGEAQ